MMNPSGSNGRFKKVILAMAFAHIIHADEDKKRELVRSALCDLCAKGSPVVNGKHNVLGIEIDCEAEGLYEIASGI